MKLPSPGDDDDPLRPEDRAPGELGLGQEGDRVGYRVVPGKAAFRHRLAAAAAQRAGRAGSHGILIHQDSLA